MQHRTIGTSDLKVAPLVFGGNVFGWTADERTSFSLLDAFVDHGLNFIDTADVYSAWVEGHQGGESETIIGKWLKESGKRDKVVLATKVGMLSTRPGLSAANIEAAVNDSLKRLKTDYIDVYFSHLDDDKTPLDRHARRVSEADYQRGKVRVIGASNYTGERLEEALKNLAKGGHSGLSGAAAGIQPLRSRRLRRRPGAGRGGAQSVGGDVLQPGERFPEREISVDKADTENAARGSRRSRAI